MELPLVLQQLTGTFLSLNNAVSSQREVAPKWPQEKRGGRMDGADREAALINLL